MSHQEQQQKESQIDNKQLIDEIFKLRRFPLFTLTNFFFFDTNVVVRRRRKKKLFRMMMIIVSGKRLEKMTYVQLV